MPITVHGERNGLRFFQLEHHQFPKPVQGFWKTDSTSKGDPKVEKGVRVRFLDETEGEVTDIWRADVLNPHLHDLPIYGWWCTVRRDGDEHDYITPHSQLAHAT